MIESQDREQLRAKIVDRKLRLYDLLASITSPDFVPAHAGFKSAGDAAIHYTLVARKEIEKMIVAHERKWP